MDPNVKQVVLVNLVIIPLDEINIVSIIFPYVPMISTGASSFFFPSLRAAPGRSHSICALKRTMGGFGGQLRATTKAAGWFISMGKSQSNSWMIDSELSP
jgi:uncharacterized protein (DUF934 family)